MNEHEMRQIWMDRLTKEFKDYENHHDSHRFLSSIAQILALRDKRIYDLAKTIKDLLDK
jgi:hypothetical protein